MLWLAEKCSRVKTTIEKNSELDLGSVCDFSFHCPNFPYCVLPPKKD